MTRQLLVDGLELADVDAPATLALPDGWGWDWERWHRRRG